MRSTAAAAHRILIVLLIAFFLATPAQATASVLVVNDAWLDGTRGDPAQPVYSENGTDSDADGNLESAWFVGEGGTLNPLGAGGPLRATGFGASPAIWTTYFAPEASPVTLANVGDSIKVTWVFTPTNVDDVNNGQNLRVAVVNSPAASRLVADGAPGNAAYTGYSMFSNMGQTLNASFALGERAGAAGELLSFSGAWVGLGPGGPPIGAPGYTSGTEYSFEMTLTHGPGDTMDVLTTMTGGTLNTNGVVSLAFSDPTPNGNSFSFDTFAIRANTAAGTAETFDTRLFKVEFTSVPEPACLGLLGVIGTAMLVRRRRR